MSDDNVVVSPESEEREDEEHEPGATSASALDLGDVTWFGDVRNYEAQVGADGDEVDYYRFTLTQAREVRLGLRHREGEAALYLEDAAGTVLGRAVGYGHGLGVEATVRTLGPGTYYVRVEAQGTEPSAHQFKVRTAEPYAVYGDGGVLAQRLGLPSFGEWSHGFELSEAADGSEEGVSLGTVSATDPNEEALHYALVGGNESGLFAIDGASGELSYVGTGEDYETGAGPYELTVRAGDGTHTVDATVTVTVTDAQEAPEFSETSYAFSLAENTDGSEARISLGTVQAADPDGDTVHYTLVGGNESGLFAIDESSGELSYVGAGEDYESITGPYELTVRASDGALGSDTVVTVTVSDVRGDSEPEDGDLPADRTTSAVVLVDEGPVRGEIETAQDWDWFAVDLEGGRTYRVDYRGRSTGDGTLVDPVLMGVLDYGSGQRVQLPGTADNEGGAGHNSRAVFVAPHDGRYYIWLAGNRSEQYGTGTYELEVRTVPVPEFGRSRYAFALAENADGSEARIALGAVAAVDPDGGTLHYRLVGGNDSGLFAIDAASGELYYAGPGEDFESVSSHELTVRASDGTYTADATVTVTVTDAPEAPAFTQSSYAFELAENTDGSATRVSLGTVQAADPDGDTVRYSLVDGNDSGLFAIDAASGELYYAGPGEDYESITGPYELTVRASDGTHTVDTPVTVTVTDVRGTSEPARRDLPANATTKGVLIADEQPVEGTLDSPDDLDWFQTTLAPGRTYRFMLESESEGPGPVPKVLGLRDSNGVPVPVTRHGGEVEFTSDPAAADTVYYVEVGSDSARAEGRGSFGGLLGLGGFAGDALVARGDGQGARYSLRASDVTDDYAADTTTTGEVAVGGSVAGELQANTDRDWFAVTLEGGTIYLIEGKAYPDDGTLRDQHMFGVYDSDGALIAGTESRPFGYWGDPRAYFAPTEDGTYYLSFGSKRGDRGTYKVFVKNLSAADGQTAGTDTSGTITVGGTVRGEIHYPDDRDWYAVELVAQTPYWIDLKSTGHFLAHGRLDPYLRGVYDSQGSLIANTTDNDSGRYDDSRLKFTAPESGTYYIAAGGNQDRVGGYRLTVKEAAHDQQTAGTDTSGTLAVGGTARGAIDHAGDRDWFAMTLEAGVIYRVDLHGANTRNGTLHFPRLDGVYDSQGDWAGDGREFNGNLRPNNIVGGYILGYIRMHYEAAQDGTYYVSVSAKGSDTGSYLLSLKAVDPYTAGTDTSGTVTVGEPLVSAVDYWGDRDWLAVTLEGGSLYRIRLDGVRHDGDHALQSGILHGVHDSQGRRIGGSTSDWVVIDGRTLAYFRPAEDGTYYVSVGSYQGGRTGAYRLTVEDISDRDMQTAGTDTSGTIEVGGSVEGTIDFASDRDWYAVELEAWTTYQVLLEGRGSADTVHDPYFRGVYDSQGNLVPGTQRGDYRGTSQVQFTLEAGGTYYLAAGAEGNRTGTYTMSIEEVGTGSTDDYAADTTTTGEVAVGGSVAGELQANTDRDWFAVTLEGGTIYLIEGKAYRGNGTLRDQHMFGVYDSDGALIAGTESRPFGYWGDPRTYFAPTEDGTYYLSFGSKRGDRGTYKVFVKNLSAADGQTAGTDTSGTITVGGTVRGEIHYPDDRDWYAVELVAQTPYWIDLKSTGHFLAHGRLDPYLRGVYDSQGSLIANTTDNDSGRHDDSRLKFTAPESGTYYIAAGGNQDRVGGYRLTVKEAAHDQQTAGTDTSGTLAVGGTARGAIDHAGDRDWFAMTLEAGTIYRVDLHGANTRNGTLSSPRLDGVYDSQGDWAGDGREFNGNLRPNNIVGGYILGYIRMHYEAAQDGTYYVSVSAKGSDTGSYLLSLKAVDPYTAGTDTSGTVTVGEPLVSAVDYWGDRDWLAVTLEGGSLYRIRLDGVRHDGDHALQSGILHGVHDSQGRRIGGSTSDWVVIDGRTLAYFRPAEDGTYYVSVGSYQGGRTGAYRLTVEDISDRDMQTAGTDTSGTIKVGGSVEGTIDFASDRDWYAVELEAWTTYQVLLEGRGSAGTVHDPYFRGVYDSQGNLVPGTQRGDYRGTSQVQFTLEAGGTYYLAAGAEGNRTGTYTMSIEEVTDAI